jgi:subtilisin family serine protease
MIDEILRKNLLWNGPGGSRNFILNANVNDYNDDHPVRHGTAVAAIAMNSFYDASNNTMLPKLMVLKALDNNGEGRLFEFCCALSYAVENHATVVNASLGYYGTDNSVLDHYAGKSNHDSIPIVAAAGNDTSARFKSYCFNGLNPQDLLINPERMFYPACLASNVKAYPVISVTGFRTPGVPCYYQNYSSEYVTMGVFNDSLERSCCAYSLPFFRPGLTIEGSSFATPVVSGRLALQISRMGRRPNVPGYISLLSVLNPLPPLASLAVTQGNQYIRY